MRQSWQHTCGVGFKTLIGGSLESPQYLLLAPKFWEVAGTLSFYECRFSGGEIHTLPYAKEFVWTFCTHMW